jgi:hypothetical protein
MKKITLLVVAIILCGVSFGQTQERGGYIGFTMSGAIPVGDFGNHSQENYNAGYASVGTNVGFVNFAYKFNSNMGIAALLFSSAHSYDGDSETMWGYGSLMVGPMYSRLAVYDLYIDVKGMVGFGHASLEDDYNKIEDNGVGFDFGGTLRYNFARKWALLVNVDYYSTNLEYKNHSQNIAALNLGIGIGYRLP